MERGGVGAAVSERLDDARLGLAELVLHEVEHVLAVEALDREDLAEDGLQTYRVIALRRGDVRLEEVLV